MIDDDDDYDGDDDDNDDDDDGPADLRHYNGVDLHDPCLLPDGDALSCDTSSSEGPRIVAHVITNKHLKLKIKIKRLLPQYEIIVLFAYEITA